MACRSSSVCREAADLLSSFIIPSIIRHSPLWLVDRRPSAGKQQTCFHRSSFTIHHSSFIIPSIIRHSPLWLVDRRPSAGKQQTCFHRSSFLPSFGTRHFPIFFHTFHFKLLTFSYTPRASGSQINLWVCSWNRTFRPSCRIA